ncbi:hypothetical protein EZV62_025978 [Acer yangbiense]|uniref:Uncharacterized protein n=1 Tax=Acer yangbiense TaxID=1000413 RepID=A0A5C7GZM3_9ROSI|nr:hypothetical protein EZV62_025978 [Acer yangbiense]
MFDGSIPVSKAGGPGQDVKLHISLVINILKGDGEVLEFLCSAWPDSIEITNLFVQGNDKKPSWPCLISVLNSNGGNLFSEISIEKDSLISPQIAKLKMNLHKLMPTKKIFHMQLNLRPPLKPHILGRD